MAKNPSASHLDIICGAFQTILDTTEHMVFVKDMELIYVASSPGFARMVGRTSPAEVVGHSDFELFEDEALARRYTMDDHKLLAVGENLVNYIEPITDDAGRARYGSTSKYIIRDDAGAPIGILGITRDITADYLARVNYQKEFEYLFTLPADTYGTVFVDIDDWRIIDERRRTVNGYNMGIFETLEVFLSAALEGLPDLNSPAWDFYGSFSPERLRDLYESGRREQQIEYQRTFQDSVSRWLRDEMRLLIDPSTEHLCAMIAIRDNDAARRVTIVQEQVDAAEMEDKITGLLNRTFTMKAIERFLRREGAKGTHALFLINADNFRTVNDTVGHQRADQVLALLAQEIRGCFGEGDIIGRTGGDEFTVLMQGCNREAAEGKAAMALGAIAGLRDPGAKLSASIGVALFPEDGDNLDDLCAKAEYALYRAKSLGKNQVVFA